MRLRTRRGTSLVEMIMGTGVSLLALFAIAGVLRLSNVVWYRSDAEEQAKEVLHRAVDWMAPDIRSGLFVDTTLSTDKVLAFVQPLKDGSGNYVIPLAEGRTVAFYLSDSTGQQGKAGTFLWRSINGVPDRNWSMRGSRAAIDLGTQFIRFEYTPVDDPEYVTILVATVKRAGTSNSVKWATNKVFLRNHSYITDHRGVHNGS